METKKIVGIAEFWLLIYEKGSGMQVASLCHHRMNSAGCLSVLGTWLKAAKPTGRLRRAQHSFLISIVYAMVHSPQMNL